MVAHGCFLDEAFGEIKTQTENKGKRKKKKEKVSNDFDKNYHSMAKNIDGFIEDEELFSEIRHGNPLWKLFLIIKLNKLYQTCLLQSL